MIEDFARFAEAIAVAARKGVQVEIMWQHKLEEDLRRKQQQEKEDSTRAALTQAS